MELNGASVVRVPERLHRSSVAQLAAALHRAFDDPAPVVLLVGASDETYCLGLALDDEGPLHAREFADVLLQLSDAPKPTLAYVDGAAIGGGFGLACSCDWLVASERATFALPELLWGLIPAMIWPAVVRRLGDNVARRWTVSAHTRSAREADDAGVLDERLPGDACGAAPAPSASLARTVRMLSRLEPRALQQWRRWQRASRDGALPDVLQRGAALTSAMANAPVVRGRLAAYARGESPWS